MFSPKPAKPEVLSLVDSSRLGGVCVGVQPIRQLQMCFFYSLKLFIRKTKSPALLWRQYLWHWCTQWAAAASWLGRRPRPGTCASSSLRGELWSRGLSSDGRQGFLKVAKKMRQWWTQGSGDFTPEKICQSETKVNLEAGKSCAKPRGGSLFWDENIFRCLNYCIYRDNTRNSGETKQDLFAEGDFFFPGKQWKHHLLNHLELISALGKGNDPLSVPRRHVKWDQLGLLQL